MCNTALIAIIKIELVWNSESQMHPSYTYSLHKDMYSFIPLIIGSAF